MRRNKKNISISENKNKENVIKKIKLNCSFSLFF